MCGSLCSNSCFDVEFVTSMISCAILSTSWYSGRNSILATCLRNVANEQYNLYVVAVLYMPCPGNWCSIWFKLKQQCSILGSMHTTYCSILALCVEKSRKKYRKVVCLLLLNDTFCFLYIPMFLVIYARFIRPSNALQLLLGEKNRLQLDMILLGKYSPSEKNVNVFFIGKEICR